MSVKFSKEFLLDTLDGDSPHANVVKNEIVDTSRWSIIHELVFSYGGKHYMTFYSVGATEQQDEGPWEYEDDMIDCVEVKAVEKTYIDWEKV